VFVRSKADKAKDKAAAKASSQAKKTSARAKKAGHAASVRGQRAKNSALSTASHTLHSASEAIKPRATAAAVAAAAAAKEGTESARAAALEHTEGAREIARERAGVAFDKAGSARDSAVAGLDRGIDSAVPVMQHSVHGAGEKVDKARDVIVDDLLPKLEELLGKVQTSKDDLLAKPDGATAVVTGAPKKAHRKGGVLIALGLLAAVGAGVAWYLSQQQKTTGDDTDPWAGTTDDGTGEVPAAATAQDVAGREGTGSTEAAAAEGSPAADTSQDSTDEASEEAVQNMVGDAPGPDRLESEQPDEEQPGFGTDFSNEPDVDQDAEESSGEGRHRA
jgi:hypothetical protein